jgi:hypothetical protein
MKKLFLLSATAIFLLSGCSSEAREKEYMYLSVKTADTFGWLFCEFDTDVNGLRKYLNDGWTIESETSINYRTHNVWTGEQLHCVGSNVRLSR